MATFREIVYTVLDEIKSVNGDSYITEEHVIFLANQYRLFLLQLRINKQGETGLSTSNEQTVCLDLEVVDNNPNNPCEGQVLRSVLEVPTLINGVTPTVYPYNRFQTNIAYVSEDRMKYVGYNKYLQNIIYCCLLDNHLYFKSNNPQFLYLEKVKMSGIFEDAYKASELSCDNENNEECKDALDNEFPLSGDMIPQMIELLVKELLSAFYRAKDDLNNSADDMADLVSYVRRNLKSNLAKQMTEYE